nr:immunoglobulin heavy chain junction region [Macaca mulatta]MOV39273.1 immunoglobulin heavy chain junction region [Macaca mulatta]MOV40338.1 immunoglobulin heavy chain junction region [Macaca mulatta]MOV40819.1 immunoglobulin heavy chain junction region [Macaca mulatta]MOV44820.1 immunoglobulin heavy chain junction region [Macaca mulatta]
CARIGGGNNYYGVDSW